MKAGNAGRGVICRKTREIKGRGTSISRKERRRKEESGQKGMESETER